MIQIPLFDSSVILTVHFSPLNREELFNLRHASARNVVERIFGILKQRFRILLLPTKFPLDVQARIPAVLSALHNFIRTRHLDHDDPSESDSDEHDDDGDNQQQVHDQHVDRSEVEDNASDVDGRTAKQMRDHIAQSMWDDYQNILINRAMESVVGFDDDDLSDMYM